MTITALDIVTAPGHHANVTSEESLRLDLQGLCLVQDLRVSTRVRGVYS